MWLHGASPSEADEALPAYDAMTEEWATKGPSDELAGAVAGIIMSPGFDHSSWVTKWQTRPKESITVPLALSGRLVGVMNASREPGAPRMDEHAALLLELLANQATDRRGG